jgi:1,2-diacylglycerol 3-alpha-glucosyltransferase
MRIAYFTDTFLPHIGGIEISLLNTVTTLAEKGHQIVIFVPKFKSKLKIYSINHSITVVPLSTLPLNINSQLKVSLPELQKVLRQLSKFNPDIIHFHTALTIGFTAIIAAKILRKPLVGTIHYYFTNSQYLDIGGNKLTIRIMKSLYKILYQYSCFIYGKCDLRLSPSKLLINELKKSGYKKTIKYLPNGIHTEQHILPSESKTQFLKQKYALKSKVVLHFGRLSGEKKVEVIIYAFSLIVKKNPDISLFVIGDGPRKQSLQKLVSKLGIDSNVIFTGSMEHDLLMNSGLLGVCDVFVSASPSETHPMVVLEAMSFGLPIVAIKGTGLTELIANNGFLVKPGDTLSFARKIEEILSNDNLQKRMQKASFKKSQIFSINKVTDRLLNFYDELVHQKKASSRTNTNFSKNYKRIVNGVERWLS